jgi:hypothetical protein
MLTLPSLVHTARTLSKALKKNKNIPKVLSELVAGLCTVTQWTALSGVSRLNSLQQHCS